MPGAGRGVSPTGNSGTVISRAPGTPTRQDPTPPNRGLRLSESRPLLLPQCHGHHPLPQAAWRAAPATFTSAVLPPGPQAATAPRSRTTADATGQDEGIPEQVVLIQSLRKGGTGPAQGEGLEDGGRGGGCSRQPADAQDCREPQKLGDGRGRLPLSGNQPRRHPRPRPPASRTSRDHVSSPRSPACGPSFRSPGH